MIQMLAQRWDCTQGSQLRRIREFQHWAREHVNGWPAQKVLAEGFGQGRVHTRFQDARQLLQLAALAGLAQRGGGEQVAAGLVGRQKGFQGPQAQPIGRKCDPQSLGFQLPGFKGGWG